MAQLALFNEGVPRHFPILWLSWPSLMRGYQDIFPIIGTIEWQATEQSEGVSKATEQSEGASKATEQSEGVSKVTE